MSGTRFFLCLFMAHGGRGYSGVKKRAALYQAREEFLLALGIT